MNALENRWIRARVIVKLGRNEIKIFTDVGASELKKLKSKYDKLEIENWGRFENPRNEADEAEKKRMKEILK
jgi:hypothetical protein